MRNTIHILLISLFFFKICLAKENKTLKVYDTYFLNLKGLKFDKAKIIANKINDPVTQLYLIELVDLLHYGGQEKCKDHFSIKNDYINDTNFNDALLLLIEGYSQLYYNSIDAKAYQYLNKGYNLAKALNYPPLQKQFVLGILELFHWEILQSNDLHLYYLNLLQELSIDPIDKFWVELYRTILASKTIFRVDQLSSISLHNLDQIIGLNSIKNKNILTKYYYEKAIYAGFDMNYTTAKNHYNKVIKHSRKLPFMRYMIFGSYIRLSDIDAKENNIVAALIKLDSARNYIDKTNKLRSTLHIDRSASKYYHKLKQYDSAYFYLQKSIATEYELKYNDNSLEISRLDRKYKAVEQEKKIVQLLNTNLKAEAQRKKTLNLLMGSLLLFVLGSCIAFLFYKNIKRKQRIIQQEHEIKTQKTEKLLKEQELNAIDAIIAGQEKERQRLANDLHDNLGSTLATIKLHFQHIQNNRHTEKIKGVEELYSKTNELLDEAYRKVRTIAHEKNNGVMANQGLLSAITKLAKSVSNRDGLQMEVRDYGLEERLDNTLEISIFRIIQELVTNTIKHANASEIHISLTNHDSLLNIIIEDDGKGFNAKVLPQKEGIGLATIEKRIEHLEGTFEIDSTIGKGTNIIINIPI